MDTHNFGSEIKEQMIQDDIDREIEQMQLEQSEGPLTSWFDEKIQPLVDEIKELQK